MRSKSRQQQNQCSPLEGLLQLCFITAYLWCLLKGPLHFSPTHWRGGGFLISYSLHSNTGIPRHSLYIHYYHTHFSPCSSSAYIMSSTPRLIPIWSTGLSYNYIHYLPSFHIPHLSLSLLYVTRPITSHFHHPTAWTFPTIFTHSYPPCYRAKHGYIC